MIVGVGSDAVEIQRMATACERYGDAFLRRVLSASEVSVATALSGQRKYEFVAGRFAAKEAIAKASGLGLGRLRPSTVDVSLTDAGLSVHFTEETHVLNRLDFRCHVSITHVQALAFAVAVLEQL